MTEPPRIATVVSENVRRIRTVEHSWSSNELAARLTERSGQHWTRQQVTRVETGERAWRIDDVALFAAALEVNIDDLIRPSGDNGYVLADSAQLDMFKLTTRPTAPGPGATVADLDNIEKQLMNARTAVAEVRSRITGGAR